MAGEVGANPAGSSTAVRRSQACRTGHAFLSLVRGLFTSGLFSPMRHVALSELERS
jgi:hypothetical protein